MSESKYTAEDLREALCFVFNELDGKTTESVFGCNKSLYGILTSFSGDEIIEKINNYRSAPQEGEIYRCEKDGGFNCVVSGVIGCTVRVFKIDDMGIMNKDFWNVDYFNKNFRKIGNSDHFLGLRDELVRAES